MGGLIVVRACDIDDEWEACSDSSLAACYDHDADEPDEFKRNTDKCLDCIFNKMTVLIDDDD